MTRLAVAAGLVLGCLLDDVLGDPRRGHPVALFGSAAGAVERSLYADDRVRGAMFSAAAVAPVMAAAWALDHSASKRPTVRAVLVALTTWTVLGGHSLRRTARALSDCLRDGDLAAARVLLPSLCGRDPLSLDTAGIARATVESVAENTSDAVVAPLFWGAVAGMPGLVGYRAVNTLDAMVGHRSPRYARFGTASARLDDLVNFVPARLTGALTLLAAPAVRGDASAGWLAWRRDARRHPSPNAGVCEASAAGVLEVQLGGRTVYGGRVEQRPALGSGRTPTPGDVPRAVRLSRAIQWAALALAGLLAGARR
jgi:adenosylcobinamide-phosphate synthase